MVRRPKSTESSASEVAVSQFEYQTLSEFRHQLAGFLRRRRQAAEAVGLEAQQYELLLAIKGLPAGKQPTVKQIAEQLQIQHHSAVELASRPPGGVVVHNQIGREADRGNRPVQLSAARAGSSHPSEDPG